MGEIVSEGVILLLCSSVFTKYHCTLWCFGSYTDKVVLTGKSNLLTNKEINIQGLPHTVFTTADPTTAIFGLYTLTWEIFAKVRDPLQSH
jgi:hypothetical protein